MLNLSCFDYKILNFLRFRSLFFSSNFLCFFFFTDSSMNKINNLKIMLLNLGFNFLIFNNNNINMKLFSSLNQYYQIFNSSFLVINLTNFIDLNKLNVKGLKLFSCCLNGYFLNNTYYLNLYNYYKFYINNYYFFNLYLIYFYNIYIYFVLCLQFQIYNIISIIVYFKNLSR